MQIGDGERAWFCTCALDLDIGQNRGTSDRGASCSSQTSYYNEHGLLLKLIDHSSHFSYAHMLATFVCALRMSGVCRTAHYSLVVCLKLLWFEHCCINKYKYKLVKILNSLLT